MRHVVGLLGELVGGLVDDEAYNKRDMRKQNKQSKAAAPFEAWRADSGDLQTQTQGPRSTKESDLGPQQFSGQRTGIERRGGYLNRVTCD